MAIREVGNTGDNMLNMDDKELEILQKYSDSTYDVVEDIAEYDLEKKILEII